MLSGWRNKIFLLISAAILLSMIIGRSAASYSAVVSVYPQQESVKIGQTFIVDIRVDNVSKLQGVDFCLKYPSSILNVSKVEEGSFLKGFGPTYVLKMEVERNYDATHGRVWVALVIYGEGFANGSGTLARVTFNATSPGVGDLVLFSVFPLRLDHVKLVTCGSVAIPNSVLDGYVTVSADPNDPPADPPPDPPSGPTVSPSPDLNGDGKVDIRDISIVARALGKSSGDPSYVAKADLDVNGIIDIRDVAIVASKFSRVV
jgi:hypothetical protein